MRVRLVRAHCGNQSRRKKTEPTLFPKALEKEDPAQNSKHHRKWSFLEPKWLPKSTTGASLAPLRSLWAPVAGK